MKIPNDHRYFAGLVQQWVESREATIRAVDHHNNSIGRVSLKEQEILGQICSSRSAREANFWLKIKAACNA